MTVNAYAELVIWQRSGLDDQMRRRRLVAYGLACVGLVSLTVILLHVGGWLLQDAVLLYLLASVLIGAVGGFGPAFISTLVSLLILNWYFVPPVRQLSVASTSDVITLATFVIVTATVSVVVEQSQRKEREAKRARLEADEAEALARTNELRAAILSAVSHDLRTPLASIKTAATTLLVDTSAVRSHAEQKLLRTVDRSVDRLDSIVRNLLDVSRVRAGAIQVQPVDISVAEVVTALLEELPEAPGRVVLDLPDTLPLIHVDAALVERVLVNIVSNALSFSAGAVVIEVRDQANVVCICVIDTGPGIAKNQRERVMQPFQRIGDSTSNRRVGLGLAVAKGFTESMNGKLSIEDTPGGGATLRIELPVAD